MSSTSANEEYETDLKELFGNMTPDELLEFSKPYECRSPKRSTHDRSRSPRTMVPYIDKSNIAAPLRRDSEPNNYRAQLMESLIIQMHELNLVCEGSFPTIIDGRGICIYGFSGSPVRVTAHWLMVCLINNKLKHFDIFGMHNIELVKSSLTFRGAFENPNIITAKETLLKLQNFVKINAAIMRMTEFEFTVLISKIKDWNYGLMDILTVIYDVICASNRYVEEGRPHSYTFKLSMLWMHFEGMCYSGKYSSSMLVAYLKNYMVIQRTVTGMLTLKAGLCGILKPIDVLNMLQYFRFRNDDQILFPADNVYKFTRKELLVSAGVVL